MAAGSIIIDLLMRTGSFETDTKRAEKRLQELKKEAQQVGAVVGAAFTAVGVAAAAMVKSSIDAADEAFKAAQAAGVSTEEYTALAYAARLNGVEQETLAKAFTKINDLVADNAKELKALGISTVDATGKVKTADQVFGDLADRFARMEEGAGKSALAATLFGERFGPQLLPLLNQGRAGIQALKDEAVQLGVVFDTETAQAAEAFNDNLSRIGAAVTGVSNRVATELLPALGDVSEMLVDLAKDEATVSTASGVVKAAVGGLITVFQTVAVVGSDVGFVFKSIGREIAALVAQADALGVGFADMLGGPGSIAAALARGAISGDSSWERFTAISDAVKADAERARAELDAFQARVMNLGKAGGGMSLEDLRRQELGYGAGGRTAPPKLPGTKGKDPDADFKAYLNNLQQQVQKTQELGVAEKLLDDIRRGSLSVTDTQKEQLLLLARQVDAINEASKIAEERAERRRKDDADALAALHEIERADRDRLRALLDSGPAAQLERQRREMLFLAAAFERGEITAEEYTDAATGYLGLTADKLTETKSLTEELGLTFASAFEEAILGGGDLSDVFKGLLQDIARVILRLEVIEPLLERIKQASQEGGGSSGGGIFKSILGAVLGSFGGGLQASFSGTSLGSSGFGTGLAYGNMDIGGFLAEGGPARSGVPYIVGERGPELFVPNTAGAVVPNHALAGGGGPSNLTILNQTTGRIDHAEERRISARDRMLIIQETRQAIARDWNNANSDMSLSFRRNFNAERTR
jgi:hypothetical protein